MLVSLSAQTYMGRKRAAVDQICVGVPAGEVKPLCSQASPMPILYLARLNLTITVVQKEKLYSYCALIPTH